MICAINFSRLLQGMPSARVLLDKLKSSKKAQLGLLIGAFALALALYFLLPLHHKRKTQTGLGNPAAMKIVLVREKASAAGAWSERGARAAIAELNEKGGVAGKKLELIVADPEGSPEEIDAIVDEAKEEPNVVAILSGLDLSGTAELAHRAHAEKLLFISTQEGPFVSCVGGKLSPYLWSVAHSYRAMTEQMLVYLADTLGKPERPFRIFYVSADEPGLHALTNLMRSVAESLSFATVGFELYDPRVADYYTAIRFLLKHDVDLLIFNDLPGATKKFIPQAFKLGVPEEMALAGFVSFDQETLTDLGKNAESAYTASGYYSGLDNAENKEFIKRLSPAESGAPAAVPGWSAVGGYSSIRVLAAAAETAKGWDKDKLIEALPSVDLKLPQGDVSLSPDNHTPLQPLYMLQVKSERLTFLEQLGIVNHPTLEGCAPAESAQSASKASPR